MSGHDNGLLGIGGDGVDCCKPRTVDGNFVADGGKPQAGGRERLRREISDCRGVVESRHHSLSQRVVDHGGSYPVLARIAPGVDHGRSGGPIKASDLEIHVFEECPSLISFLNPFSPKRF